MTNQNENVTKLMDRLYELNGLLDQLNKKGETKMASSELSAEPSNEILELVDKNGNIIGTATRKECHSSPQLLHKAVHVFVLNTKGQIFLQKRSRHKIIQPLKWDSSVGGHVDLGESDLYAAKRETFEELGVSVSEDQLIFLHKYLWRSDVESELITSYKLMYEGEFDLSSIELEEGRFFTKKEIETMIAEGETTENFAFEYHTRLSLLF